MAVLKNTSYKVHVQHTDQTEVDAVNIEDGAMLHTTDALYMGHNNNNVVVYPQNVITVNGWARYDDTTYTSSNKLSLADGVEVVLPNNAGAVYRSHPSITFYNGTTNKVLAINENDVYQITVVFRCSAANANQTYLSLHFEGGNGTPYDRIRTDVNFPKGNDVAHDFHQMFQYYTDSDFVTNGTDWKITSNGGAAKIWDIIYFIQRTQNADFS
jgi:hypothetical protein